MSQFSRLFKFIQLTRSQVQNGYALDGVRQGDLSNLAEHHYLVTFMAWQIGLSLQGQGTNIDLQKVLEQAMVHDLGELFGGDIAMPYSQANSRARQKAKEFEAENQKFIAKLFKNNEEYISDLFNKEHKITVESLIVKIADYMEVTHFKQYLNMFNPQDIDLVVPRLVEKVEQLSDQQAQELLKECVLQWSTSLENTPMRDALKEITS